jgi:formyl-CoA transferase/CoA:oxalate CoA-transferase
LHDLLAVDFTRAVAGPFATMMLGDLGARVIKIEEPARGDESRGWGPPFLDSVSTYFLAMNRNKQSVAVDLKSEKGRQLILAIASRADVLIENFRPGVMSRLGLGYEDLVKTNPGLVYCSISGFGQTGPDRDRPGYDLILQGVSGLMDVSRAEGEPPVKTAFPVTDILAGLFANQSILASLYARRKSGKGRFIDISLLDGMLCAMSTVSAGYLLTGEPPKRVGPAQQNIVPYQMFRCAEGAIVCGTPNERLWRRFCAALGQPQWLEDPRYRTNADRNVHRSELVAEIEAILASRNISHWIAILEQHEIPCGPVLSVAESLAQPAAADRGVIVSSPHPRLGPLAMVAHPARLAGHDVSYNPPPDLGQHTEAVFSEFLS